MLVIISGPSGVGKNTIIEKLLERNNEYKYLFSCTTREPRDFEIEHANYIYLTQEDMNDKIENGELFEFENIHDNIYGTLNSSIEEIKKPNAIYLKDLGVLGKKYFSENINKKHILSIFLDADNNVLDARLTGRGEKQKEKRMSRADFERSFKDGYDLCIDNKELEETVDQIEKLIKEKTTQKWVVFLLKKFCSFYFSLFLIYLVNLSLYSLLSKA